MGDSVREIVNRSPAISLRPINSKYLYIYYVLYINDPGRCNLNANIFNWYNNNLISNKYMYKYIINFYTYLYT